MSFVLRKVFNQLPPYVSKAFFDKMREYSSYSNDCYVSWEVNDKTFVYNGETHVNEEYEPIVDGWLKEQGCEIGETVIIEHSW